MAAAEEGLHAQLFEGLESPFLDQEPSSGQSEKDWSARLSALEAESPFLSAFEHSGARAGTAETESAKGFEDTFVSPRDFESSSEFEFEDAGIINGDNRVRVKDTTGVPWRWICKVDVADSRGRPAGSGTGLLISNRHVLTAAHVVYDAYQNMQQYTITVIPALNDLDEPFDRYSLASKPKIRQEYDPTAADSLDWDYALLTLSTAVGKKKFRTLNDTPLCYWASPQCGANTVFARLDPRTLFGKAAYTAGYPGGRGGKQLWCAAGILHSANEKRRTMYTTADTTKGQSGSPVWIIDNKMHCLVGVAVGASTGSNTLVRVTRELVRQLRAWIAEAGETPAMVETEEAFEPPILLVPESDTKGLPYLEAEPLPQPESDEHGPSATEWTPEPVGEDAEELAAVKYEEGEVAVLDEQPLEEQFNPAAVPHDVADALERQDWPLALRLAIQAGWHNEFDLTNLLFFKRHPEIAGRSLGPAKNTQDQKLSREWGRILQAEVRPAIQAASGDTHLQVAGKYVAERDPVFSGESGKKFKELVEWAASEVQINPGLLAAVLLAEWDQKSVYLSGSEVRSFLSGVDDFFAMSKQLAAKVPAFARVRFDASKKTTDINEHGRKVTTIPFKSGRDAALATAVYLKYGETKIRKAMQENGGEFDKLPIETQFALVRIAMAAGHGGITPEGKLVRFKKKGNKWVALKEGEQGGVLLGVAARVERVLKGEDILVRDHQDRQYPSTAQITDRNATILAAQAIHLSDWIFGNPPVPASQLELEESEHWDEGEQAPYNFVPDTEGGSGEDSSRPFAGEREQIEVSAASEDHLFTAEEYGGQSQEDKVARDEESPPFPVSFQTPLFWHEDSSLRHAFRDAIGTVSDDAHKTAYNANGALPDVSTIPMVIVALGPGGRPSFAGQNMYRMYYSGSLLKVAAMYGAFQLRKAVSDFANTLPFGFTQDQVFQRFERASDAKILTSAPTLPESTRVVPKYTDILKVTPDATHYKVEFLNLGDHSRRDFDLHLHQMVEKSHNPSAGVCIQNLGYSWINGVLREAGMFNEDAKEPRNSLDHFSGIWLAGDYLLPKWIINKQHQKFLKGEHHDAEAEEEFQLGISGLTEVRIPSVNDGPSKQAASCLDLANLMVQVANGKLIAGDAAANTQIVDMLKNAVPMSIIGRRAPSTHFRILQSKIGFGQLGKTGSCLVDAGGHTSGCVQSEALIIQETKAPNRKYVVIYQNIQDPVNHANQDLWRVRDIIDLTIDKF